MGRASSKCRRLVLLLPVAEYSMPALDSPDRSVASTEALPPSQRFEAIDSLRGLALFGVLAVNLVTEFRVSIFTQFLAPVASPTSLDAMASTFVSFALESKAFALFSMLFGLGLAMQADRLAPSGRAGYLLTRRLVVLLGFGLVHLLLIWNGDILTEYALAGLLILPLLRLPNSALIVTATALFAIHVLLVSSPTIVPWPDAAELAAHVARANAVYANGSYREIIRFSFDELRLILPLHVWVFPRTLALFLFGALVWRSGVLRRLNENHGLVAASAAIGLVAGIALTHAAQAGWLVAESAWGAWLTALAPVLMATGYGSLVLWAWQFNPARLLLHPFAAVGRMAFTNYILQSVIFVAIFFGYGLGGFGRWPAAPVLLMGAGVYAMQVLLSMAWLGHFRFGPIEWLWRSLMYARMAPMRRAPGPATAAIVR